jgi:quercetin dioxygenase-like cupin family protein
MTTNNQVKKAEAPSKQPPFKLLHGTPENQPMVEGRRDFYSYRDLGLTDATGGRMSAQIQEAKRSMDEGTGWHYHLCEGQFIFMLQGSADLEFEDYGKVHFSAGECIFIPGNVKHNAVGSSADMRCIEMNFPADFGTVVCEAPKGS